MADKAFVSRHDAVKPWVAPSPDHREVRIMLSPDRDGTLPGMSMGIVEMPPGFEAPAHQHEVEQEAWYFFEGKGKIKVGDEVIDIEPGTVVASPPKTPHALISLGPDTLRAVLVFTPAGPEKPLIQE